jgi:hypothetical protein
VALNEVLDKLALEHPIKTQLLSLRYFAGTPNEEAAKVSGFQSPRKPVGLFLPWLSRDFRRSQCAWPKNLGGAVTFFPVNGALIDGKMLTFTLRTEQLNPAMNQLREKRSDANLSRPNGRHKCSLRQNFLNMTERRSESASGRF